MGAAGGDTRGEAELIIQSVVRDVTWTLLHTNVSLIVVTLHTNVLTKISGPKVTFLIMRERENNNQRRLTTLSEPENL